jgi:hypothetical protein
MSLSKDSATSFWPIADISEHCTCPLLSPKRTLLWLTGRRRVPKLSDLTETSIFAGGKRWAQVERLNAV